MEVDILGEDGRALGRRGDFLAWGERGGGRGFVFWNGEGGDGAFGGEEHFLGIGADFEEVGGGGGGGDDEGGIFERVAAEAMDVLLVFHDDIEGHALDFEACAADEVADTGDAGESADNDKVLEGLEIDRGVVVEAFDLSVEGFLGLGFGDDDVFEDIEDFTGGEVWVEGAGQGQVCGFGLAVAVGAHGFRGKELRSSGQPWSPLVWSYSQQFTSNLAFSGS